MRKSPAFVILYFLSGLLISGICRASSLSVWPVNPHLLPPAATTAIWVRNGGEQPMLLQARVFRWRQENAQEILERQDDVIISPPMIEVPPKIQQLFRVVHRGGPPEYPQEQSYRILIDEIPAAENAVPLRFQMRYSLPFFIFAAGTPAAGGPTADDPAATDISAAGAAALSEHLSYRIIHAEKPLLQVINHNSSHVRLSQVRLQSSAQDPIIPIAEGLLGYVLPKSTMTWPLTQLDSAQLARLRQWRGQLLFVQDRREYSVARAD